MQTNEFGILVGSIVGWQTTGGKMLTGKVTSYRAGKDRLRLQILRDDGSRLWIMADIIENNVSETFCVIKHGPTSLEYGLLLAELILEGKGTTRPVNVQLTTLAATAIALKEQLDALSGASETPLKQQEVTS